MSALVHSPPLEGWQAKPDEVVVKVLNNVTPIDLLAQSAVLSDGVVVKVLSNVTPIDFDICDVFNEHSI